MSIFCTTGYSKAPSVGPARLRTSAGFPLSSVN